MPVCIRQELVVYVNGVPYTRRELEMPAAVLHHAGVQASQVCGRTGEGRCAWCDCTQGGVIVR
jgi:hypothetical protein